MQQNIGAARLAIDAAQKKKTRSMFVLGAYTVALVGGYIYWLRTKYAVYGFRDYLGVAGLIMAAAIVVVLFVVIFTKFRTNDDPTAPRYYWSYLSIEIFLFCLTLGISLIIAAVIVVGPVAAILYVLDKIGILNEWLLAPTQGFFEKRGERIVGWVYAVVPYVWLTIRIWQKSKEITKLTQMCLQFEPQTKQSQQVQDYKANDSISESLQTEKQQDQ